MNRFLPVIEQIRASFGAGGEGGTTRECGDDSQPVPFAWAPRDLAKVASAKKDPVDDMIDQMLSWQDPNTQDAELAVIDCRGSSPSASLFLHAGAAAEDAGTLGEDVFGLRVWQRASDAKQTGALEFLFRVTWTLSGDLVMDKVNPNLILAGGATLTTSGRVEAELGLAPYVFPQAATIPSGGTPDAGAPLTAAGVVIPKIGSFRAIVRAPWRIDADDTVWLGHAFNLVL